jgi:hypothetical protein
MVKAQQLSMYARFVPRCVSLNDKSFERSNTTQPLADSDASKANQAPRSFDIPLARSSCEI